MKLSTLIQNLSVQLTGADPEQIHILGLTEDSRLVRPGWVFVARPGVHTDGTRFIPQAIQAGALAIITSSTPAVETCTASTNNQPKSCAIVLTPEPARIGAIFAERLAGEPSRRLKLVGITGTNGKTTIAHLLQQCCAQLDYRCGLVGTVSIDDGADIAAARMTTPAAEQLSPLLAAMVTNGCRFCAMEVSSHALDQHRVSGLHFAAAIFTNLTGDHLDYHHDMPNYARAKASLFASLGPDAIAIVNADDKACETMLANCCARIIHCRLVQKPTSIPDNTSANRSEDQAWVCVQRTDARGMKLCLAGPWGRFSTQTTLVGAHNAMNILQALVACSVCFSETLAPDATALGEIVATLFAPTGRLEAVSSAQDDITVLVDFAHTDDALASALRAARSITPEGAQLWAIFGCGGDKDRTKRPRMGAIAAALADVVVLTSDNPRTEPPEAIIDEIIAGMPDAVRAVVHRDADRRSAIRDVIAHASPGDVLVLAGKGHEREQEIAQPNPDANSPDKTVRVPLSDHEEAIKALKLRQEARRGPVAQPEVAGP